MQVEVYYDAPSEVIDLSEEEEELWIRYNEALDVARKARRTEGWRAATVHLSKADHLYEEFFDLISDRLSYQDVEVEDITEW